MLGSVVTLNGAGSWDQDGDRLTYQWSFISVPSGSAASLSNATEVQATFTTDQPGEYVAQLVVSDGRTSSMPSAVAATAATGNSAPVAKAAGVLSVKAGATAVLDGSSSSDADGDPLTYSWSLTVASGSAAALSDATAVAPTFVADQPGDYVAELVVSDGKATSAPSTVTITAAVANTVPTASAGPAQNVKAGAQVTLDGSGSTDADGDVLTYAWSFRSVPSGSTAALSSATVVKPTFTADGAGSYVAQLLVSDGKAVSAPAVVTITAAAGNSVPVANAGAAQSVTAKVLVTLDGSGSRDADGDALTYAWSFRSVPSGSAATLSSATAVKPTFMADAAGSYVAQLVVSDGKAASAASTVTITAAPTMAWIPTFSGLRAYLASSTDTGADANNDFVAQSAAVSLPPVRFSNPAVGRLRLYNYDGHTYAVNFNGDSVEATTPFSTGGTVALSSLTRSLSMTYAASSGPVTLSVVHGDSSGRLCAAAQILILNTSGKILKAASACNSAGPTSVTFTDAANTELFIAFTRVTDSSGGLRVFEIDLTK